ncbi:hypothetical protein LX36DRAFT_655836 [Colletotrichum falcatum]|nr:hypothetical protein LX36DRAFT_655836 [Colletotrichum falcatum]
MRRRCSFTACCLLLDRLSLAIVGRHCRPRDAVKAPCQPSSARRPDSKIVVPPPPSSFSRNIIQTVQASGRNPPLRPPSHHPQLAGGKEGLATERKPGHASPSRAVVESR